MSNLESERLDRIEQHLKLLKQDSEIRSSDIKEIKQALYRRIKGKCKHFD